MTCGSVLKLASAESNIRLHSHDVKYGSGSGQQVQSYLCVVHSRPGYATRNPCFNIVLHVWVDVNIAAWASLLP